MNQNQDENKLDKTTAFIVFIFILLGVVCFGLIMEIDAAYLWTFVCLSPLVCLFLWFINSTADAPTIWDSREKREGYARKVGQYKKIHPMTPKEDGEKNEE